VSDTNLRLSLLMYTSYFVLFARFFYNAYFGGSRGEKQISGKLREEELAMKMASGSMETKKMQ